MCNPQTSTCELGDDNCSFSCVAIPETTRPTAAPTTQSTLASTTQTTSAPTTASAQTTKPTAALTTPSGQTTKAQDVNGQCGTEMSDSQRQQCKVKNPVFFLYFSYITEVNTS